MDGGGVPPQRTAFKRAGAPRPPVKLLALLVPLVMLGGCTQLDDAQVKLEEARADAQEARDRYDRVRSATVARTEIVNATAWPMIANQTLRFDVEARRAADVIPAENLTALTPLWVRASGFRFACDPLTCAIELPPEGIEISWSESESGLRYPAQVVCVDMGATERCGQPPITGARVQAHVTTAVGDVTD